MCGRYTITKNREKIEEFFNIKDSDFLYSEIFNAYPSQELPIITSSEKDKMSFFKWGLIPFWSKDPSISNKLINARSETIIEKPSFKPSFKKRRCLVIADGYYEWKTIGKEKQPYRIKLKTDQLFAMAGIYDFWKDGNDNIIKTFSIITTSANDFLSEIHSRMPVIFDQKEQLKLWLDNSTDEIKALDMLKTMDSEFFDAEMVSKKINVPSHNQLEFI
ncbi:MAG: SOS response-associated peptidase [Cyanobacteriota bacterium]